MVGPERPLFVLFGSSIVELSYSNGGWGAILSDIYSRKAGIVLRGYCRWNSRRALQVLDKIFPKDAAIQPSLVIVYFGGSDSTGPHSSGLGPHIPLPEYIENMRKIGEHLKVNSFSCLLYLIYQFLFCTRKKKHSMEKLLHWKSLPTEFSEDSPYDLVASDRKTTLNPSE